MVLFAFWIGIKTAQATYIGSGEAISLISHNDTLYVLSRLKGYAVLIPVELELTSDGCYKLKY